MIENMVPAYDAPEYPATDEARTVAAELINEVEFFHRLDPVVSIVPVHESVHVTVRPESLRVWQTWVSLFKVRDTRHMIAMSHGHGTWQGVPIVLVGLDPQGWR